MPLPIYQSNGTIPSSIPAPMINADAARLQDVQDRFKQEDQGINTEAPAKALESGINLMDAVNKLDETKRKAVLYRAFQSALDAGWPEYEKHWQEAGSPPEWEPGKMKAIAQSVPPDKAQEVLIQAYKGITDKADQNSIEAGRKAAGTELAAGGDQAAVVSKLSVKDPNFKPGDAAKNISDREAKATALSDKMDYWAKRDAARNNTILKAAGIHATGGGDFNAIVDEVTGALTDADTDIVDRQAKLDALDAEIGTSPTRSQAKMRKDLSDSVDKAKAQKKDLQKELFKAQAKGGHKPKDTPPPAIVPPPIVDKANPLGIRPPKKK